MLGRWADLISRRARLVLACSVAVALVAAVLGGSVADRLSGGNDFQDPGSQSERAFEQIRDASGVEPGAQLIALVRTGTDVRRSPAARALVRRVQAELQAEPRIARVLTWYDTHDPTLISTDGRATYLPVLYRAGVSTPKGFAADLRDRLHAQDARVTLGGGDLALDEVNAQVKHDLASAELLAFPILFMLSLWFFRGLVAALLPLFVGGITIVGTFLCLRLVNDVTLLSIFALNLVTGMGLGLGIDYSLFIVSRYREELARHGPGAQALRATMLTAGRTVLFSALTVAGALASLLVFPLRFLYSMGIGGAIVALVAAATALIALPALLAVLGPRVDALAPRGWRRRSEATARGDVHGGWYRLSRAVMRRPAPIAVGAAALLIALGIPFLGIQFTGVDASVLPAQASARQVDDALRADFPRNHASPVQVAIDAPRGDAAAVAAFARRAGALPGVASVAAPQALGARLWEVDVTPSGTFLSASAKRLVTRIRALDAPFPVAVTGDTARFVDQQAALVDRLPLALAILTLVTICVLFAMTGSVLLPIKALAMNLLTISAAFGLLVLIFQDGRLEGLLDFRSQGALESTQPVLLFAVAFGLSTDYGVFLLGRIKEAHDRGLGTREAVATGLERTGRIVTAAAILFCVAIGSFATSQVIFIKELGVGTALAVLIDATIVRALLVPALMALLGRWNWWAPPPLRRLHERIGLAETDALPASRG